MIFPLLPFPFVSTQPLRVEELKDGLDDREKEQIAVIVARELEIGPKVKKENT